MFPSARCLSLLSFFIFYTIGKLCLFSVCLRPLSVDIDVDVYSRSRFYIFNKGLTLMGSSAVFCFVCFILSFDWCCVFAFYLFIYLLKMLSSHTRRNIKWLTFVFNFVFFIFFVWNNNKCNYRNITTCGRTGKTL